ncbi:hypothetical protein PPYR_07268 [Photinus pyralis]|uniref:ATR-interacting protein mus304 n=1 Tax=Photinus pyralis TaxID=7054 RepID=A0A1Y1LR46_PHOPY|nr:uncharacterized protein LOC116169230 [Photinus pyralis]KAB0799388.1 hypothetical protein PPYR_07268 [Photinus pyralis]
MSKRNGKFNGFKSESGKKQKMDNVDDLWGDDLDIKDVEDCFMLASQVCEQPNIPRTQLNNVSILPSYEGFQQNIFTSTQINHEMTINKPLADKCRPITKQSGSTSTTLKRTASFSQTTNKEIDIDVKIKKLEEDYESKAGEVGILRSNLRDVKAQHEAEHKKIQKEWSEKLFTTTKQLQGVESQLQFKNLEIVNLTQKLKEATKINNGDASHSNTVSSPFFKRHSHVQRSAPCNAGPPVHTEFKVHKSVETRYPLNSIIDLNVFRVPVAEMCFKDIDCMFMCPTVQNYVVKLQPPVKVAETCRFDNIYDSMKKLKECNQLQLLQNKIDIDKLWDVAEHLVKNVFVFLQSLGIDTKIANDEYVLNLQRLLEDDTCNLDERKPSEDEMGIYTAQTIRCITEIVPYNTTVNEHISHNDPLLQSMGSFYFTKILTLVTLIRKLKLFHNFKEFLKALIKFLDKICTNFTIRSLDFGSSIFDVTREIILCVPSGVVMSHFIEYLSNLVLQSNCLTRLCTKCDDKELKIDQKTYIVVYEKTTCILHILFMLLDEMMKRNTKYDVNVMQFIASCLRCNGEWFSNKESKRCFCVSKAVRMYVDLMYKTVQRANVSCSAGDADYECLRGSVDTLIFLSATLFDVVVKYAVTFSRYTVIIASLLHLQDSLNLSELEIQVLDSLGKNEEVQKVDEEKFKNISPLLELKL